MKLKVGSIFIVHGGAYDGNGFDELVGVADFPDGMEKRRRAVWRLVVNLVCLRYPYGILQEVVLALDAQYERVFVLPKAQREVKAGCTHGFVQQDGSGLAGCDGECVSNLYGIALMVEGCIHAYMVVEGAVVGLASSKQHE